jgi:hypothetical protein
MLAGGLMYSKHLQKEILFMNFVVCDFDISKVESADASIGCIFIYCHIFVSVNETVSRPKLRKTGKRMNTYVFTCTSGVSFFASD